MHFTDDIDIPDPLIESLSFGNLVIFIGAGVSAKAYKGQEKGTYYPLFTGLVQEIAARSEIKLTTEERHLLDQGFADRILGEWNDRKIGRVDVHKLTASILQENEKEQRINLHEAILNLFPKNTNPMIVTTNFDNLFVRTVQEKIKEEETKWKIYEPPTLPPLKRFALTVPADKRLSGICFLHGRVTSPHEMILTDRDIGRAYMDEGWALKFAHDLFSEFNVLFIGYSLQDPPLRYLSLALETTKDKNRWALIPEPADVRKRDNLQWDWKRRGVSAIWYPAKNGNHRALEKCIVAWSEDNRRGFIDRKNLLYEWGRSTPTYLLPHQLDRAHYFLGGSPELLRDFVGKDLHKEWFDNLIEWGHLGYLLKGSGDYSKEADYKLAQIISAWLIENPIEWLVKLTPFRETINPLIFEVFLRIYKDKNVPNIEISELRKILEFFSLNLDNDDGIYVRFELERIIEELVENSFFEDAVWLFGKSIRSHINIGVKPNFRYMWAEMEGEDTTNIPVNNLEFEYSFINDPQVYHAEVYIDKLFKPNIEKIGSLVLKVLTYKFYNIRLAIKRGGGGTLTYIHRKAIERNEVTDIEGDKFFIDSLRDLWEALLSIRPEQALKIYKIWMQFDDPIFQRLSLHALRHFVEIGYVE